MFSYIWHSIFYNPAYNLLVWFVDIIPNADLGVAVILTVVLMRLLLLPLSIKATRTQLGLQKVQDELKDLQEKHKDDRVALAEHTMAVYKRENISPTSVLGVLLIQLPFIIAIYLAVRTVSAGIHDGLLYPFVHVPSMVNTLFLGRVPLDSKNIPLALLAGITAYWQARYMLAARPPHKPTDEAAQPSFANDFAESMRVSNLYMTPVMISFFSYQLSAVIALYFTISNLATIAQEWYLRMKVHKKK